VTSSRGGRRVDQRVQGLYTCAAGFSGDSVPRKHHLVPAFYLRRWAVDGKIRVTHVDESRSYVTAPERAARETDYYRLEAPDLDATIVSPLVYETLLGEVEQAGKKDIDRLCTRVGRVAADSFVDFAVFLTFQMIRGHGSRREQEGIVAAIAQLQFGHLTNQQMRRTLQKSGIPADQRTVAATTRAFRRIIDGNVAAVASKADLMIGSAELAEQLLAPLLMRDWYVYHSPALLVTCDEPVISLGVACRDVVTSGLVVGAG